VVTFGQKFSREDAVNTGGDEGGSGKISIWGFRDGSTTIRFLEEIDDWTPYWEHYDQGKKKYFPCPGRDVCPVCTDPENESRASKRYLVNALVKSSDNKNVKAGYVNLYKIPGSLIEKVLRRSDKYETLLDRDYEIIRAGSGLNTEYDLETGDRGEVDIETYLEKGFDHEEALQAAWKAYGADAAEEPKAKHEIVVDETPAPRRRAKTAQEVEDEAKPTVKERVSAKSGKSDLEKAAAGEDPPSEPQSQSASADAEEEEEVLSEETVRAMDVPTLRRLYDQVGLTYEEDWNAAQLADNLIDKLGE